MSARRGKYDGMTVNERLYEAGLIDDFDKAVADDDRVKIQRIATAIGLVATWDGSILKFDS